MALINWLRKQLSGDDAVEITHNQYINPEPNPDEEMLSGLNLKQVLDAHTAWKGRLQKAINGTSTEDLDVSVVAQDSFCVLGKWMYGTGKQLYSHLPEYESLRQAHANFHLCAGEVLTEHQDGNLAIAEVLLKTKFRTASNKNQLELVRLFTAVKR